MQARGAARGGYHGPSRATPQTPLSLPTLRDRADSPHAALYSALLRLALWGRRVRGVQVGFLPT